MDETNPTHFDISEPQEDSSPPELGEIKEYEHHHQQPTITEQSPPELEQFTEEQYEESHHEIEVPVQAGSEEIENANQQPPQHKFDPEDIITHNIFVGDLKSDVVEQDLFDTFRPCGEIHSVHIFRDPHTQEQKGFGFVHFMTREAQHKALSDEFKNIPIKDRPCRVSLSEQKNTLFVGGLPTDMTEEEISVAVCSIIPPEHVVTLELKKGPPPTYDSRGFCFIQFVSHGKADNARRTLAQSTIKGRQLNVAWAETRHSKEPDPDELEKVKTLYVSNLSITVNEQVLQSLFQEYGSVVNCVIVRNQQSKQSRGFAFVEFADRENAIAAQVALNGYELSGQNILVVLAKPMITKKNEKGAAKKTNKGGNNNNNNNNMGGGQLHQHQQQQHQQRGGNRRNGPHHNTPPPPPTNPSINNGWVPPPPPPHQVYNPNRQSGGSGGRGAKSNRGGRGGGNTGMPQNQRFQPYQQNRQPPQQQQQPMPAYPNYTTAMPGMYASAYSQGYSMPANMAAYYSQPYAQNAYAQYQQYAATTATASQYTAARTTQQQQQQQQQMAYYPQYYQQQQ